MHKGSLPTARAANTKESPDRRDMPKAVIYARVSSKEQEREGFSIPAQLKLLHEYAETNGFKVAGEHVDIETAKRSGRLMFNEMVSYLRKHTTVRTILVEKTDRLYRNLKDWVTMDELDVEIHFVKEGVVLSNDSRSSEKFMHGIKVLMAKNYIDNLSEETRKGLIEKAEQGLWPTVAPFGYRNVLGPDGKKIIEVDAGTAPLITRIFEWYSTGLYSLKDAGKKAREEGLVYRRSRNPVSVSTIHAVLRNRLYTGTFEWLGKYYKGTHEPLVTHELWQRVQCVLDGRHASRIHGSTYDFIFTGLVKCGHCGCAMVGEIKKAKYVYYHCTGFKGKCGEKYVREEVLQGQFVALLEKLNFDDSVLALITKALRESFGDEKREHNEAIARLRAEWDRLQRRLEALYIDKLDGSIDADFYQRMKFQWRDEQDRCQRDIDRHTDASDAYMDEGVSLLTLAQKAHKLFGLQAPFEKRKLLNCVLSNCTWQHEKLIAEFRQPFDLIVETNLRALTSTSAESTDSGQKEIWLRGPDSNRRPIG
jgi:site-specific DNA recombinase